MYVLFGVYGSWSSKYVAGSFKEDEFVRLVEMCVRNDGKVISFGVSVVELVIYNMLML